MDKIADALGKLANHADFAALAAEIDEAAPQPGRDRGGSCFRGCAHRLA
jgi:hypothetical protein